MVLCVQGVFVDTYTRHLLNIFKAFFFMHLMLFLLTWIKNTDTAFNKVVVISLYEETKTICNNRGNTKLKR